MADEPKKPSKRIRNGNVTVGKTFESRKVATVTDKDGNTREYASAGRYTTFDGKNIKDDVAYRTKLRSLRGLADSFLGTDETIQSGKIAAGIFGDGGLGFADIADSNNIGYYSYEFPVDALELPASRAEELRFFRLAYDRDPIVGRAIDLHTELPLSKMELSKPKSSSEEYADYVFDEYQRFVQTTKLFQILIDAVREYWTIGETFIFIEKPADIEPCKEAMKQLEKGKKGDAAEPGKESQFNTPLGGTSDRIIEYLEPSKRSSWAKKRGVEIDLMKEAGIGFDFDEDIESVLAAIKSKRASLNAKTRKYAKIAGVQAKMLAKLVIAADSHGTDAINAAAAFAREKLSKLIGRIDVDDSLNAPIQVTADFSKTAQPPGVTDPGAAAPAAPAGAGDAGAGAPPGAEGEALPGEPGADPAAPGGDPGAPLGDAGLGDISGGGGMPMGGGGGGAGIPADMAGEAQNAIAAGASITAQRELMEMKHLLGLLEKKRELLEELKEIREKKQEELELFSHVTNKDYDGPTKIRILPPEQMEIANEGQMEDGPTIYYKPPEEMKQSYLEDPDVPAEIKEKIQTEGKIPLNQDPMKGSYVIHLARKKSGYELHGRSILQRCIRTVIYREKLRQVQSTLASRNMTPKTMVIAPGIPTSEVMALRAHIDEAKADPDYSVVLNYEARWDEIGSEGRLLVLDGEYQHTNSDLAIGLGLSPEILIGEGMYSGNRIQLEIMNVSYLQFRDLLTGIIEDSIFKPLAMEKGFYEMDKYGRPRWIFPKVSFSRMALRDSGDLYDMLFNLYSKGSLPVDIIYEFLNLDPEDCERKLEDALFTVKDSKFNEMLSNIYGSVGEWMMANTDLGKRLTKGLTLNEVDHSEDEGPEGSGEGV
jgi:hypothetical protein